MEEKTKTEFPDLEVSLSSVSIDLLHVKATLRTLVEYIVPEEEKKNYADKWEKNFIDIVHETKEAQDELKK